MSLEAFFKKLIQSKLSYLLYPLSCLYGLVLFFKKNLSSKGHKIDKITVVSIGNIDFGGSGKTPVTLKLLSLFDQKKTAVISRGYKSKLEHQGSSIANVFKEAPNASDIIGDEPLLILEHFPEALMLVGKDRKTSLKKAVFENRKIAILDDGAQVTSIHKDFNIILCDPQDPIKPLFPCGYRRDLAATLNSADFVIFTYCFDKNMYKEAKKKIAPYYQGPTCGFKACIKLDVQESKIAVLCAIARPERFLNHLQSMGYEVIESAILDDHATFNRDFLESFIARCHAKNISNLVCTEKDFVKLPKEYKNTFKIAELAFEAAFDASFWESFIGKIQKIS
jgi:tetraacyldisaccharide 4'-kinase